MLRQIACLIVLLCGPALAQAQTPRDSGCLAMSAGEARVIPAGFGPSLDADTVRLWFLGHASFAVQSPGGTVAITDYTGLIGNLDLVPDVVTMNNAHDTHFTDTPDPRIPLVLRGWGDLGQPARIDERIGDLRIRNVTSDLRGPFGEGGRKGGNSIFLFEAAGLCIGHLGHLHQILSDQQHAAIGRLDVVMVPVDGGYTMDAGNMARVVQRFRARVVVPMHWFSGTGLAAFLKQMQPAFEVQFADGPEVTLSLETLPRRPTILVLEPALLP